jgi:hypothetical protein
MSSLSELQSETGTVTRIAVIKPQHSVLFTGEVSTVQAGGGFVIQNAEAIKSAYPGGEIIYIDDTLDIAEGYIWDNGAFSSPVVEQTFAPYEIFSMFTEIERGRYFSAVDAGDVNVRSVAEMMRLQSGTQLSGTHPVVQAAVYILRLAGVIEDDERMTEIGNFLQGI